MALIDRRRLERIGTLLQKEIADIVDNRLGDPRLGLLSITGVRVSADLSAARVYIAVLGDDEARATTIETLHRASSFVRSELAKRVSIRQVPALQFMEDVSQREGVKIDTLLRQWREEAGSPDRE